MKWSDFTFSPHNEKPIIIENELLKMIFLFD